MTTNTAIAKRTNETSNGLALVGRNVPGKMTLGELKELASVYVDSGSFPDLKNVAQAIVKIKAGEDLGFSPHVAIAGIHFFQGRAVIGANLLASLIKDSGKYEYKVLQNDKKTCSIQMMQMFGGEWRNMGVPVTYTIEDAQVAGLTSKDVWKKFPADMLFAAVIRQACRRYCADVLRGTPTFDHYDSAEADIDAVSELPKAEEFEQSPNVVDQVEDEADLGEPISDDEVAAIEEGKAPESTRVDLETAVNELLGEKTGGDTDEIKKILKGRETDKMTDAALTKLHNELFEM